MLKRLAFFVLDLVVGVPLRAVLILLVVALAALLGVAQRVPTRMVRT